MPRLKRQSSDMKRKAARERKRGRMIITEEEEDDHNDNQEEEEEEEEEEEDEVVTDDDTSSLDPAEKVLANSKVIGNDEMEITTGGTGGGGGGDESTRRGQNPEEFNKGAAAVVKVEYFYDESGDVEEEEEEEEEEESETVLPEIHSPQVGGGAANNAANDNVPVPVVNIKVEVDEVVTGGVGGEGEGNEQDCLICGELLKQKKERDVVNHHRGGANFFESSEASHYSDCGQLLKDQLWAMFVLRRVLGLPEEECSRLLKVSFGLNPADWFDLCGGCSGVVEAVLEMQEQVRVLEGKMKGLRAGLKGKLDGILMRVEKNDTEEEEVEKVGVLEIRDEIRKYFKDQLASPKKAHVGVPRRRSRRRPAAAAREGEDVERDDDDGAGRSVSDSGDSDDDDHPESDPLWTEDDDEDEYQVRKKDRSRSAASAGPRTQKQISYPCPDCGKVYNQHRHFIKHRADKHSKEEPDSYSCTICSLPYSNFITLRIHMRKYHPNGEAGDPQIQCEHCDAKLFNSYALNLHRRKEHSELYNVSCDHCDYVCTSSHYKYVHTRKVHHKEISFDCELCDAKFDGPGKLDRHIGARHEKAIKSCSLCGSEVRLSGYRRHLTTCKIKQKSSKSSISSSSSLARKSAAQKTRFKCEKCGYSTTHKRNWKCHLERHEYDDHMRVVRKGQIQCTVCSAMFTSRFTFQTHLREMHHAELGLTVYPCGECGLTFGYARTLAQHQVTKHSGVSGGEERKSSSHPDDDADADEEDDGHHHQQADNDNCQEDVEQLDTAVDCSEVVTTVLAPPSPPPPPPPKRPVPGLIQVAPPSSSPRPPPSMMALLGGGEIEVVDLE